jgi:type IV secretory system conjugative DNA transfer VirD4/TraG family protein
MDKSNGAGVPVTLMIDEAFVLGPYEQLETAASILRGFGCRLTMVFQSYGQIKKLYPETHGLFTAGAILSFRPADSDTGKWLVEKAGKVIVPVLSAADPTSPADFGVRPSWQQQLRDRIPLHKMFGMPRGRALVWKPGDEAPRMSWVKGYFEIPELAARAPGGGSAAVPAAAAAVGRRFGKAVKVTAAAALLAFAGFAFVHWGTPQPEKPVPARVDHPPKAHAHAPRNIGH